ncbi:MAG: hypothetical protein IRY90_02265, partial [Actinomadura rubrobrunea]|nr:hypothetical protein [Actinomadura rubrobrunea]
MGGAQPVQVPGGGARLAQPLGPQQQAGDGGPLRLVPAAARGQVEPAGGDVDAAHGQVLLRGAAQHVHRPPLDQAGAEPVGRDQVVGDGGGVGVVVVQQPRRPQVHVGHPLGRQPVDQGLSGGRMRQPPVAHQARHLQRVEGLLDGGGGDVEQLADQRRGRRAGDLHAAEHREPAGHREQQRFAAAQAADEGAAELRPRGRPVRPVRALAGAPGRAVVVDERVDQQRIAAADAVEGRGVVAGGRGAEGGRQQAGDAVPRQRDEPPVAGEGRAGDLGPEGVVAGAQRVGRLGEDEQHAGEPQPPLQVQQRLAGRLIGELHVVDGDDDRLFPGLPQQGRADAVQHGHLGAGEPDRGSFGIDGVDAGRLLG